MPTIPNKIKHFFCRITAPYDEKIIKKLPLNIKTKHYNHDFINCLFVHELGNKTKQWHYHFSIACKTTKPRIMEWIRNNFNKSGNEGFQTTDKYEYDTQKITLAYMYKGGANTLNVLVRSCAWPSDIDNIIEIYNNEEKLCEFIKIYNNDLKATSEKKRDEKFEYFYDLVERKLNKKKLLQYDHDKVFGKIYYLLTKENKNSRRFWRRSICAEHAYCLSLHFCNDAEVEKMIINQTFMETKKILEII